MLQLNDIIVYPVKSLQGVHLQKATITDRGLENDRRWMLIDDDNNALTQRQIHSLAQLAVKVTDDGIEVSGPDKKVDTLKVGYRQVTGESVMVTIWGQKCRALLVGPMQEAWFSAFTGQLCRMVYMPNSTRRRVDANYAPDKQITTFTDGFTFHIVGEASLNDLNSRIEGSPIPMDRFRPNFVFTGGEAYEEDDWGDFRIGDVNFKAVKPCPRCSITTTDQQSGEISKEPLATLSTYRKKDDQVYFGQNLIHKGRGMVSVGDIIEKG